MTAMSTNAGELGGGPPRARRVSGTAGDGGTKGRGRPWIHQGADRAAAVRRLQRLAWLLDSSIALPGSKFRVGLDPILGLVPGVGDAISAGLSAYILVEASRLGTDKATLARMAGNVLVDMLVGAVPVVGDALDFAVKANRRNLRLLGIWPGDAGPGDAGPGDAGPEPRGARRV